MLNRKKIINGVMAEMGFTIVFIVMLFSMSLIMR